MENQKYFLYARKSTDVEDKQVLSIEAQLTELRAFARSEGLHIAAEFVEKQTAKVPGRSIFNDMMKRIERGEAQGIVSWHPDRLARNSVDGGQIIHLLDTGVLASLKFPTFWCDNTSQGKFMLSMAFGQSKYYVDSLSENTKRGLRQKVRLGHCPSKAPIGYINDVRTKTIIVDRKRAKVIKQAFQLYAVGDKRLEDIADFLAHSGVTTRTGKRISKTRASFILSNPFYVGLFKYGGELHEGKHEPIITKPLFDEAQVVLKKRGQPDHKPKNEPQPYCGLISCASCGMMITAENKMKRQKNGNIHHYVYYRCTKKHKSIVCKEPSLRSHVLDQQISSLIKSVSLPTDWAEKLERMAQEDHANSAQSVSACVKEREDKLTAISQKLDRLLNGYLDQVVDELDYRTQKAKLLSEKKTLQEEITSLSHTQNNWLAPFQDWLKDAMDLDKIASDSDLFRKKVTAKEIFGSHLRLGGRQLGVASDDGAVGGSVESPTAWAALRAAHAEAGQRPTSSILVGERGLEPPRVAPLVPKTSASTNFATRP